MLVRRASGSAQSEGDLQKRASALDYIALGFSVSGGLLLVVSAFLPAYEAPPHYVAVANTLWDLGDGWSIAAGGALVSILAARAFRRRRCSWAGFWVGAAAVFLVVRLGGGGLCSHLLMCVKASRGTGIYGLGVGGAFVLIGWAIALLIVRGHRNARTGVAFGQISTSRGGISFTSPPPPPPPPPPPVGSGKAVTVTSPVVWSAGLYAALSVGLLGTQVLDHFGSAIIGQNDFDPSAYMWFLAWWPHAVVHGLNPFVAHGLFVPDGYNLAWATSVPGLSLILAPVTWAFGPVVTFNVLALGAPALSAWTAFLLCVHITHKVGPSLVGGWIFGFSPYVLRVLGAPNLSFVALVPLLVLLVLRSEQGSLRDRPFVIWMALALAFQALTGVEILVTATLFGVVALLASFGLFADHRRALTRTGGLLLAAYAAAGVLVSPMLFYLAFRPHAIPTQANEAFANDLLSWFRVGSRIVPVAGGGQGGLHGPAAGPGYLGLPLLLLVALYIWRHWRDRSARLLVICLFVPAIASLGGRLMINGKLTAVGLPWAVFGRLPGLERAIPQRFTLFAFLAAAVMVAIWLARQGGRAAWVLALVAVGFFVVNADSATWEYPVTTPSFFATRINRDYLRATDRVLVVPNYYGARWQAATGFSFQLAGGYLGAYPASYARYPIFTAFTGGSLPHDYQDQLRRFVTDKGVTVVALDTSFAGPQTLKLFGSLGVAPRDIGGTLIYRLRGP